MAWTLIAGGARNLGADICRSIAKKNNSIVIQYYTNKEKAKLLADECISYGVKAEIIYGDFSSSDSTNAFIKNYLNQFKDTENFIYNVGNYKVAPLEKTDLNLIENLYQTNLFAFYNILQNLLPSLEKYKGSVITLGVAGLNSIRAENYATAYYMTKSSLLVMIKAYAKEWATKGVRFNMISPGYLENSIDLPKDLKLIPLGKPTTYQEISELIIYLLSESARSITGQNIEVAGGTRL